MNIQLDIRKLYEKICLKNHYIVTFIGGYVHNAAWLCLEILTAMRVPSITATRFTFTACLHVLVPSDVSSQTSGLLPIPAQLTQISSPPYVRTCFSKEEARSSAYKLQ